MSLQAISYSCHSQWLLIKNTGHFVHILHSVYIKLLHSIMILCKLVIVYIRKTKILVSLQFHAQIFCRRCKSHWCPHGSRFSLNRGSADPKPLMISQSLAKAELSMKCFALFVHGLCDERCLRLAHRSVLIVSYCFYL